MATHGIMQFKSTGVIGEKIKGRKKLTMGLNRLEKELKAAVKCDNVQNDIQISLLRYQLTIIGLFNLYVEEVGLFDPHELRKHRLTPQPVFRFIQPAILTASRILKTLDCGISTNDAIEVIKLDQQAYLDRMDGKRKGSKGRKRSKSRLRSEENVSNSAQRA